MSLETVKALLRKRIGLDPDSLGPAVLPSVVAARQRVLGIPEMPAYAARVQKSPREFDALVNELVVSETWFFRSGQLFPFLAQYIRQTVGGRSPAHPFRALSAPSSTGEEPYSLAIALTELQVPRARWHIDACDVNQRFLDRARLGRYTELSFRQTDAALRDRYFRPVEGGWQLDDSIRTTVEFRRANLIEPGFLRGEAPYDLIFCRNLLIYLHDAARRQVIHALEGLLAPGGLIAMGHAEPLNSLDARFCHVGPDGCFLFARAAAATSELRRPLTAPAKAFAAPPFVPVAVEAAPAIMPAKGGPPSKGGHRRAATIAVAPSPSDPIATARRHADAGRLDEAWAECQSQLAATEPTADLFALLGMIEQARHDQRSAQQYFEKALYLDPHHGESLMHLILLHEQQGAARQVAVLRTRLERANRRGDA